MEYQLQLVCINDNGEKKVENIVSIKKKEQ